MTGLWGGEEKSLQWIVEQVKTSSESAEDVRQDVAALSDDMRTVQSNISTLQTEIANVKNNFQEKYSRDLLEFEERIRYDAIRNSL
jgi:peptidoglycan hydrolase CwlO-like protein